jgi:hypothetical protein
LIPSLSEVSVEEFAGFCNVWMMDFRWLSNILVNCGADHSIHQKGVVGSDHCNFLSIESYAWPPSSICLCVG